MTSDIPTWQDRLAAVKLQFPDGCKVRRKLEYRRSIYTKLEEAVIVSAVVTGRHKDILLKVDEWFGDYLNPEYYEVVKDESSEKGI